MSTKKWRGGWIAPSLKKTMKFHYIILICLGIISSLVFWGCKSFVTVYSNFGSPEIHNQGPEIVLESEIVSLPLVFLDGLPFVKVSASSNTNSPNGYLLIDTGSPYSFANADYLTLWGDSAKKTAYQFRQTLVDGQRTNGFGYILPEFSLGDISISSGLWPFYNFGDIHLLTDLTDRNAVILGVVGMNVLASSIFEIDLGNKRITFFKTKPDTKSYVKANILNLARKPNWVMEALAVDILADSEDTIIDTGSRFNYLSKQLAENYARADPSNWIEVKNEKGLTWLGGKNFQIPEYQGIKFAPSSTLMHFYGGKEATIGLVALKPVIVLVDYADKAVYLKNSNISSVDGTGKTDLEYEKFLMTTNFGFRVQDTDDGIIVAELRRRYDSPDFGSVKLGDKIVAFNGSPISKWAELNNVKEGVFTFRRGSYTFNLYRRRVSTFDQSEPLN